MSEFFIRTNGRGNAWPVFLGQVHPYYKNKDVDDLANASFSVVKRDEESKSIEKELLIDTGHGTIQYLLKNHNRIPDAVVLTHPHIDHTLSLDWLAQSHFRFNGSKYPVYSSRMCWNSTLQIFPQLKKIVEFKELSPGKPIIIDEFADLEVVFYPVFHGESAQGAGMIYIRCQPRSKVYKALFTGDLLCTLLRNQDYSEFHNCDVIYTDSNNRFPYPKSNHWSIAGPEITGSNESEFFKEWIDKKGTMLSWLIRPNLPIDFDEEIHGYFDTFLREQIANNSICYSVFDFVKKVSPKYINLIHYSGREDKLYNQHEALSESELMQWTNEIARNSGLNTVFRTPQVGDEYQMG